MQPYKSKKAIRFAKSVDLFAAFSLFFGTTIGPALAQQAPPRIVIDQGAAGPHPTLDHTQNGLDQVNIAHPNGAGVSHNAFTEYGVKQNGIILNNAIHNTTTQTGGAIMGNPNLGGQSAHLILNEVTGNLPSRILGYTEVAGDRAAVVIANPNGITCSGCGFINTTRASLVTGHPEMDAQGNLHSFRIQDGTVSIEGNGGDFTTVPVLDILSRRVRLKAQLNANDVTIVAGRNRVDYGTNAVHPLEKDDSQKPEWAIDTAALGGLYAHNIYMVVNEAGAGVRVDGKMAANAGDMHLTANGDLVLNGTLAASGKMQASVQGSITNTGTWQSGQDLSVQSGTDFSNSGTINNQSGDITLQNSGQFANQGTIATPAGHLKITAGGDLSNQGAIGADENRVDLQAVSVNNNAGKIASRTGIAVQGEKGITNKGGQISTVSGTADILTSGDLDNSQGRILNSGDYLTLRAANVTNQGGAIQGNGTVKATLAGYDADKGGILSAGQDMALSVNGSLNNGGNIIAQTKDLTLQAGSLANSGIITAKTGLDLNAGGNSSNHGELSTASGEAKVIIGGDLDNSHGRILNSTGDLTLQAGALSNQGGAIQSQGALNATLNGYNSDTSSSVTSQKTLTVTSQNDVDNEGTMGGVAGTVLQAAGVTNGVKGQLLATNGDLVLSSASLKNEGVISTDKGRLTVTATGHASNDGQIIGSSQDVTFKAGALDNGQTGIITAKTGLDLNAGGNSSNHGELSTASGEAKVIIGGDLDNSHGRILNSTGDLTLQAGALSNQGGAIQSQGALNATLNGYNSDTSSSVTSQKTLTVTSQNDVDNEGTMGGVAGTVLQAAGVTNGVKGQLLATNGDLVLSSASLKNEGVISTDKGRLTVTATGHASNDGQIIGSSQDVTFKAGALDNGQTGIITAKTGLDLNAGGNSSNHGELSTASGEAKVIIGGDLDNSHGRILNSTGDLTLQAGALSNQGGAIQSQGALNATLNGYNSDTSSSVTSQKTLTVTSQNDVDNEGTMGGVAGTVLQAAGVTNGVKGQLLATNGDLVLSSASLKNEGVISTDKGRLTVTATGHASNDGQIIGSSQDVTFKAGALDNGQTGIITAKTGLDLNAGGNSSNHGELSTASGEAKVIIGGDLDNSHGRILNSTGDLTLQAGALSNQGGAIQSQGALNATLNGYNSDTSSSVTSQKTLTVTSQNDVDNEGTMGGVAGTVLQAAGVTNGVKGQLLATNGDLVLSSASLKNEGVISTDKGRLTVTATGHASNDGQIIGSSQDVTFKAGALDNGQTGIITAKTGLDLNAGGNSSNHGELSTASGEAKVIIGGDLDNSHGRILNSTGDLTLQAGALSNQGGAIQSQGALNATLNGYNSDTSSSVTSQKTLTVTSQNDVDNEGTMGGVAGTVLQAAGVTNGVKGQLLATNGDLVLSSASLKNEGVISTDKGRLTVTATGHASNDGQIIGSSQDVTFKAGALDNGQTGIITAKTGLDLNAGGNSSNHGELSTASGEAKVIIGGDLDNSHGRILNSTGDLTLQAGALSNQGGAIQSQGALNATLNGYNSDTSSSVTSQKTLTVTSQNDVDNEGTMGGVAGTVLQAAGVTNGVKGQLLATNGDLVLSSASLKNEGVISTDKGRLTVTATGHASNDGQIIGSSQDVTFKAGALDNGQTGIITAKTGLDLNAGGTPRTMGSCRQRLERRRSLLGVIWIIVMGGSSTPLVT